MKTFIIALGLLILATPAFSICANSIPKSTAIYAMANNGPGQGKEMNCANLPKEPCICLDGVPSDFDWETSKLGAGDSGEDVLVKDPDKVAAKADRLKVEADATAGRILERQAALAANAICSGETGGCDVQMVVFGTSTGCLSPCTTGTCTICQQVGTKITSVTFSTTGSYMLNGLDQTKWACSASGHSNTTGQFYVGWTSPTNGSSTAVNVQFGIGTSPVNTGGITATCVGKP
jgi:hypothetical protein